MRVVAIEEHHITPEMRSRMDLSLLPPAFRARLHATVGERLADMDAAGIDVQVPSVMLPMPQMLPAETAVPLAAKINGELHGMVTAHPDRFAAFALLPVTVPDAAADELERAVSELGFAGAMISGTIGGRFLDDPVFAPVLETAARLNVPLGRDAFDRTSMIASSTFLPQSSQLKMRTTRGHDIVAELPWPADLAPLRGRPTIYLDQNHWSTLTKTIHQPERVTNERERTAAAQLIELAKAREVVLPMSSAHLSETVKQADPEQRYQRALTIAQLTGGWQLRDPLDLRRFELRQALTIRYRRRCLVPPAPVTLEPGAVHSGRDITLPDIDAGLPPQAQWAVHAISCTAGIIDALLDAEQVPMPPGPGWTASLQQFAAFLRDNPVGKELKRRRINAWFIADLGRELPEEAYRAGVTPAEMSDWALHHSEEDLPGMPALGIFREVLYEKLSDGKLRWADNDLFDMVYLTTAAGYCDYVVGERAHTAHIANALRRLGRADKLHRHLQSLMKQF